MIRKIFNRVFPFNDEQKSTEAFAEFFEDSRSAFALWKNYFHRIGVVLLNSQWKKKVCV